MLHAQPLLQTIIWHRITVQIGLAYLGAAQLTPRIEQSKPIDQIRSYFELFFWKSHTQKTIVQLINFQSCFRDGFALAGYASSDEGTDTLGLLSVVATPTIDTNSQSMPSGSNYDAAGQAGQALKVAFKNQNNFYLIRFLDDCTARVFYLQPEQLSLRLELRSTATTRSPKCSVSSIFGSCRYKLIGDIRTSYKQFNNTVVHNSKIYTNNNDCQYATQFPTTIISNGAFVLFGD